jgi:hypothetical protein
VKSSGGQSLANIGASNFGGTAKTISVSTAVSAWTQKSITGIAVTNGSCQVDVTTTGTATQTVTVDDVNLVRTGP